MEAVNTSSLAGRVDPRTPGKHFKKGSKGGVKVTPSRIELEKGTRMHKGKRRGHCFRKVGAPAGPNSRKGDARREEKEVLPSSSEGGKETSQKKQKLLTLATAV